MGVLKDWDQPDRGMRVDGGVIVVRVVGGAMCGQELLARLLFATALEELRYNVRLSAVAAAGHLVTEVWIIEQLGNRIGGAK